MDISDALFAEEAKELQEFLTEQGIPEIQPLVDRVIAFAKQYRVTGPSEVAWTPLAFPKESQDVIQEEENR